MLITTIVLLSIGFGVGFVISTLLMLVLALIGDSQMKEDKLYQYKETERFLTTLTKEEYDEFINKLSKKRG